MGLYEDIINNKKKKKKQEDALFKEITSGKFKQRDISKNEEIKTTVKQEETMSPITKPVESSGYDELYTTMTPTTDTKLLKQNKEISDERYNKAKKILASKVKQSNLETKPYDQKATSYKELREDINNYTSGKNTVIQNIEKNKQKAKLAETSDVKSAKNKRAVSTSQYEVQKAKEDYKGPSAQELLMSPVRGAGALFKSAIRDDLIIDNDYDRKLPSYNDTTMSLNQSQDNEIYNTVYGFGSELGKQGAKKILDKVSFNTLGNTFYYKSIYDQIYSSARDEGYSKEDAGKYAIASVGGEAALENLIGGSKYLTGGKKTIGDKAFSSLFKGLTKSKFVNDLVSSSFSEGGEEGLENQYELLMHQLILEKKFDPNAFISKSNIVDTIKSMIIGAGIGGTSTASQRVSNVISDPNAVKYEDAIYRIESETGEKVSDYNKNAVANLINELSAQGIKANDKEIANLYNSIKNVQAESFENNAISQYSNLDDNSRVLYNNEIKDISNFIRSTGVNVRFDQNLTDLSEWKGNTLVINPSMTDMPIKTLLLKELGTNLLDEDTKVQLIDKLKQNGMYDNLKEYVLSQGVEENRVDNEIVSLEMNSIFENEEKLKEFAKTGKLDLQEIKSTVDELSQKLTPTTKDYVYIKSLQDRINKLNINENNLSTKELQEVKQQEEIEQKQSSTKESVSDEKQQETNKYTKVEEKPLKSSKNGELEDVKDKQLKIIKESNPMTDDYHVGIREKSDIKTFKEAIEDEESFTWGDFTKEDAEKAFDKGKITVYSSYPIKNGVFVSTSQNQARDYAGGKKIYSKEVPLNDVAWINGDEGQYAKVDEVKQESKETKIYTSDEDLPTDVKKGSYIKPTTPIKEDTKKGKNFIKQISGEDIIKKELSKNYSKFVDSLHIIQQIADASGNTQLYAKMNNRGMSNGMGQYQIGTAQTDINGLEIGDSINDIFKPVENAKLSKEFDEYLAHRLNEERYDKVPVWDDSITPEVSREIIDELEEKYPQFKEWADKVYKFNDNQLQKMIDAGLSKENARDWLYKNYVTISRDIGPKTSPLIQSEKGIKVNSPIRRAKGGELTIKPMKESMQRQALLTEKAISDNIAGLELLNVLGGTVGENNGFLTQTLDGENNALTKNEDGTYNYTVYKNGTPVTMQITKEVADAIKPMQKGEWEDLLPFKAIRGVSKLQRTFLTDKNPMFIFTNFFKDLGDAPLNSRYTGGEFFATYPQAIYKMATNSKEWKQYVAKGGKENTYFDTKTGEVKQPKTIFGKGVRGFTNAIENANQFIEQAPRFTEYLLTLAHGGTIDEALYNSAEVTTNFARGGEVTKALNRNGFNFLNASVQGFDKQIRNFTQQPGAKQYVKLLAKVAIFGVTPALLNHMLLDDDDDYEELPDYVKDNYYLFKTGDNKFLRIPKGRVISIFGTAARHSYEIAQGDEDIKSSLKDTGEQIINNVAPNNPIENNILSPLLSVKNNKSWSGSKIVSTSLENYPDAYQYDEKTSSLAKWLGKTFNKSPKKIDYLLDQYTGAIGDIALPMMTPAAESEIKNPLLAPFASKFSVDSTISNKYVNEYYDKKNELEKDLKTYSSINESEETMEKSLQYKYLDSVGSEISQLYIKKREIQNSNYDDEVKYTLARNVQRQIDDLAKFAMQDYTEGYYTDNYGIIGDKEFQTKITNGKLGWSKIDEKTKKKQENYAEKYDMSPEEFYAMDSLTKSAITGKNIYEYVKINNELTTIRDNTTKDQEETIKYIRNLDLSLPQKAMYMRMYYSSYDDYNYDIINYVNSLQLDFKEKKAILIKLGFEYNKKTGDFSWK